MEKIILFTVVSAAVYFGIAALLILIDKGPAKGDSPGSNMSFRELFADYSGLPELSEYKARDGKSLYYRHYPSHSRKIMILLHGSGAHSRYFFPLAGYLSSTDSAEVYTPDLRGHGFYPERRGDTDYINQLEDDLADFISRIKREKGDAKIILAGHSSGGGLALRFAGSRYSALVDACLLLSPYLKYNAPTMRSNSGGWARVHTPRIIGLSLLNNLGITLLNHLRVIDFILPGEYRDGSETLSYSYRLNRGYAPEDYQKDFRTMKQRAMLIAGSADEAFRADLFLPEVSRYKKVMEGEIIKGVTHMGLVMGEEVRPIIVTWLQSL
ncbi:MAG: alpha/beta hydrolase [Spirochaetales bacterium]|nr:alpha/beta hydrolase [Spirochaetales bacterium]